MPSSYPLRNLLPLYAALIAILAIVVRFYLLAATGSTAEDFYITLRYAENIAHGHGYVYNPGEAVLGTTSPLYTLLLALFARLGLDPILLGKSLGILADGLSCLLLFRLGRAVGRPGVGLIAAALYALSPPNLTWAISGMETALVTATGLTVFVFLAERRPYSMAGCAAALVLLRIDGLLLAFVAFGALWWRVARGSEPDAPQRKTALPATLLFVALLLPWLLFATLTFGSPIPNSAVAKVVVYGWQAKTAFPNLQPFAYQMAHTPLHLALLAGVPGLRLAFTRVRVLRPATLWLLLYYLSLLLSKVFLFGWYYIPPSPLYFFLAALGWGWVLGIGYWVLGKRRPTTDDRRRRSQKSEVRSQKNDQDREQGAGNREPKDARLSTLAPSLRFAESSRLSTLLAALILLFGLRGLPGVKASLAAEQAGEERLRKRIGRELRTIVGPDERVMLEPIGYIGYFSGRRILDAVGLVSPEVLRFYRSGAVSPYLDMLAELHPDYVLLRTGEYRESLQAEVSSDRALTADYTLIRTFRDPERPPDEEPAFYLLRRKRY